MTVRRRFMPKGSHGAAGRALTATLVALIGATSVPSLVSAAPRVSRDPACITALGSLDRASLWAPPLDRLVTLRVADVSVRDAIDRLASAAHVELSYSADLLPADSRICLSLERVPMGAILDHLLDGTTVRPIVVGSTQVVLAPSRLGGRTESAPVSRRSSMLDRVVVTGSPDGAAQRGSPYALDVIEGTQLTQHGVNTLGEALELSAPGVWTWNTTAGAVTARYGSIRGASSFGVSAPKVYLDGIEVANALMVTQIDPSRVARVEVIRGPQGAALYGADAISGVVNILTRHDGTTDGRRQLQFSTIAGVSSTAYAARDPFVQEHSLTYRRGSASRNLGLGANVGTVGAYVPGASERRLLLDADGRFSRQHTIVTGYSRFALQRANAGSSLMLGNDGFGSLAQRGSASVWGTTLRPALSVTPLDSQRPRSPGDSLRPVVADSATGQELAQYTVGGSVAMMPNLQWTHTLVAGVDGYRLQGLSAYAVAGPQALSSAANVGNSDGAADRASVRWRTVGRFDVAPATLLTLTLGMEQAFTHEVLRAVMGAANAGVSSTAGPAPGPAGPGSQGGAWASRVTPATVRSSATYDNTGLSAQLQLAWHDRWFASAGVRGERIEGATPNAQQSLLPMLGMAYVRDFEKAVVKLRGAFGTGIRPARSLLRTSTWMGQGQFSALTALEPEKQSGTEAGVDVLFGSRVSLRVTRFDQRATGLIQPVSAMVTAVGPNGRLSRALTFTLQNVGAITNRGWEMDATTRWRRFSLAAALATVDSRVAQVAPGYRGDLRVGDRMLEVPAATLTLTALWSRGRWTLSSSAVRASDWVGYDRSAIGTVLSVGEQSPRALEGSNLRQFWTTYPGVTRWRAGAEYRVRSGFALTLSGENLLNVQTGTPDNATVVAGRTLAFGIRTLF